MGQDHLCRADAARPALVAVGELLNRFTDMVRIALENALTIWLNEAGGSMLASFARGLRNDQTAVAAALRESLSNRQTEGQINRLKTLKRRMYGRATIHRLKGNLVAAS